MADTEMAPADGAAAAAPPEQSQALVVVPGAPQPATSTAIVAAGDVRTAGFDLNEIKKLATQTKAIGVIMPPPDIRAIVDKTASFVAKHGPEFEKRILANERNNAKFNFLVPTDPYHAFYQMRIKHYGSEVEGGDGAAKGKDASAAVEELGKASVATVQVIPHALAKLEKPEEELYTVHVPQGLSLLELDIIRLAAQFVARNGKSFLTGLASREHTNPLFNFLRPTHSLFGFFTSLCDAYSRVLMPPKDTRDKLARDANDAAALLDRARKRLEWERVKERELQEAADEAEKERVAYQSIDWHDFVVVETIEFDDDEDDELPPPLTLKDVITMNKAREYAELEAQERAEAEKAAQEKAAQGVPMSEEERALIAQAQAVSLNAGQPPAAGAAVTSAPDTEVQEADMEMDVDEDEPPARPAAPPAPGEEEDEEPIRVVKDYVRPQARMAMYNGQAYDPTKFVVSPITGELVAINDMAEHMRISLIDPRWKEQREAMLSKIRDNTKASDDEIARNLTTLAGTRPDIFGSTEEEVTQVVTESIREKLTSGASRPVAWDGVTQRGPELATQLANIHQNRTQMHHPPPPSAPGAPPGAGLPPPPGAPPVMGAVAAAKLAAQRGPPPPPPTAASLPRPPTLPPPPRAPMPGTVPPIPPPPVLMRPPGPPPMGGGMGGGMPPPPPGMGGGPGGMLPPPPGGMPPPGPPRAPPPPREAPPPMPGDQPEPKRARLDDGFVLQPEEEFLQQYPGPSSVRVQCPEVEGHEKLIGQLLEVQVASLQDTVGEFKERLSGVLALPANKMKLSREGVGFLRDEPTLAHYNVAPAVVLTLGTKERARGKKA